VTMQIQYKPITYEDLMTPSLDLTGPLTLEEMYKYLSKMWLQAFKEQD